MAKLSQVGTGLRQNAEIDDTVSPFMQKVCTGGVCTPDPNQMYGYSKYGGSMEPYGNPVYEGTGYPAAGFGERRRKVVPLKGKQFKFNPQTQEYEPTQRFTTDKVNVRSDFYSPVVASFGGLSEYPAITYPQGKATLYGVRGLGQAKQPSVDTKKLIAELQKLYGEALNRVDKAIKDLEQAAGWFQSSEDKAKIALYKRQAADNRRQYNEWNALKGEEWVKTWSNTEGLKRRFQSMIYFAEQIQASAAIAKVSFWDGFWERLGKNYMDLLAKFPTPKDVFAAIPWVVGGIALIAFFPLIRRLGSK